MSSRNENEDLLDLSLFNIRERTLHINSSTTKRDYEYISLFHGIHTKQNKSTHIKSQFSRRPQTTGEVKNLAVARRARRTGGV